MQIFNAYAVAAAAALTIMLSLPAAPVAAQSSDWTGYTIGVDFGLSGGRSGDLEAGLDPARDPRLTYTVPPAIARFDRDRNLERQVSGSVRGGRMFQSGPIVWGVEGQAGLTNLDETFVVGPLQNIAAQSNFVAGLGSINNSTDTLTANFKVDAVASLRARIGVPISDRILVSAFAGPALARARLSASQTSQIVITRFDLPPGAMHFNTITTVVDRTTSGPEATDAIWGGTVGGGIEYRVSDAWSLHGEAVVTFYDAIDTRSGGSGGGNGGDSAISYAPVLYSIAFGVSRRF